MPAVTLALRKVIGGIVINVVDCSLGDLGTGPAPPAEVRIAVKVAIMFLIMEPHYLHRQFHGQLRRTQGRRFLPLPLHEQDYLLTVRIVECNLICAMALLVLEGVSFMRANQQATRVVIVKSNSIVSNTCIHD